MLYYQDAEEDGRTSRAFVKAFSSTAYGAFGAQEILNQNFHHFVDDFADAVRTRLDPEFLGSYYLNPWLQLVVQKQLSQQHFGPDLMATTYETLATLPAEYQLIASKTLVLLFCAGTSWIESNPTPANSVNPESLYWEARKARDALVTATSSYRKSRTKKASTHSSSRGNTPKVSVWFCKNCKRHHASGDPCPREANQKAPAAPSEPIGVDIECTPRSDQPITIASRPHVDLPDATVAFNANVGGLDIRCDWDPGASVSLITENVASQIQVRF